MDEISTQNLNMSKICSNNIVIFCCCFFGMFVNHVLFVNQYESRSTVDSYIHTF